MALRTLFKQTDILIFGSSFRRLNQTPETHKTQSLAFSSVLSQMEFVIWIQYFLSFRSPLSLSLSLQWPAVGEDRSGMSGPSSAIQWAVSEAVAISLPGLSPEPSPTSSGSSHPKILNANSRFLSLSTRLWFHSLEIFGDFRSFMLCFLSGKGCSCRHGSSSVYWEEETYSRSSGSSISELLAPIVIFRWMFGLRIS